jgi:hypothetical protein
MRIQIAEAIVFSTWRVVYASIQIHELAAENLEIRTLSKPEATLGNQISFGRDIPKEAPQFRKKRRRFRREPATPKDFQGSKAI